MGIFDDAIRQHLDLKRRLGAEESELKQLADEAFGPPARPGEPEFGETGENEAAEAPSEVEAEAVPAESAVVPAEAAVVSAEVETASEPEPEVESLDSEPEGAPPPEAEVEVAPEADEGAAFTTSEREAIAEQPTTFFDQQISESEPGLELEDLDLDLEEELEEEVGGLDDEPVNDPPPEAPEAPVEIDQADEQDGEPSAEDVLEETPEFLRDNPDDDELWFEQGKPKDFDF